VNCIGDLAGVAGFEEACISKGRLECIALRVSIAEGVMASLVFGKVLLMPVVIDQRADQLALPAWGHALEQIHK
jgi:hypothetical protein